MRKRILSFMVILTMISAMIPTFSVNVAAASFTGSGNEGDPYLIENSTDLKALSQYINGGSGSGEYFKLTTDINLGGSTWTPIGTDNSHSFKGTFDGGGRTISGLSVNSAKYAGLFGQNNGTIKNLNVKGSVAASNAGCTGGIVGYNFGVVSGCSSDCTIGNSDDQSLYVGGIAGENQGKIQNCYNTGSVSSNSGYVGGIVGLNIYGGGVVEKCYNKGTVSSGSSHLGGIVGFNNSGSVSNCYYLNTCGAEGDGTSKTEEEFKSGEVAWLLQNGQDEQVWGQKLGEEADTYPVLTGEENNKVLKVTFATQENESYDVKYTNFNGTVTLPSDNPTKDNYEFAK